jgi:hypothetical protein
VAPQRRDQLALPDDAELLAIQPGLGFAKELFQGRDVQGGNAATVTPSEARGL